MNGQRVDFGKVSEVLFDGKWRKIRSGSFRIKAYDFSEAIPAHGATGDGGRLAFAHWEDESGTWACPAANLTGIRLGG